jgi:glycosyltransferase involved in cell wall biosynthesis
MSFEKRKLCYLCTQDWFFYSHFLPLGKAAVDEGGYRTSLITQPGKAHSKFKPLGIRILPAAFNRRKNGPFSSLRLLWQLVLLLRNEKPDIIHLISLKPIIAGSLAAVFVPGTRRVYHLTGMGFLAARKTWLSSLIRCMILIFITRSLRNRHCWLIVENPDDLEMLDRFGTVPRDRVSVFGGAGVDPGHFTALPLPGNTPLRLAFAGRMVWSKGVDIVVEATSILARRGIDLKLELYGIPDPGNPRAITRKTLEEWEKMPAVTWHGFSDDIRRVWVRADIAIMPSRGGEGLPRSLLEAAACGRPLVVTDVPGCRHFVRDGIEGLVIPPENPQALADALEKLAADPDLRARMGKAARERVLDGFTEQHMRKAVLAIYRILLDTP